jgi:aspartate/tyrosine/aromatic aminotransferase
MASGTQPSKTPKNGATVAVAVMTNPQLAVLWDSDVSVGAIANRGNPRNGLKEMLADGRIDPTNWQNAEDSLYVRYTLGVR